MKGATKWFLGTAGTLLAVGLILRGIGFMMGGRGESQRYFENIWANYEWDWDMERSWGPVQISPDGVHVGGANGIHVDSDGVDIGGDNGIHIGHHSGMGNSGKTQLVESGELTGITSVEVDVDCGDLWIREGESVALTLEWNLNNYNMTYQVKDGVLKVEDESWGNGKNNTDFQIKCKMILTLPKGNVLDEIDLSTNMGDILVDAAVTAKEVQLSTDLGDVVCRTLQAVELEAESDLGDITVTVPAECKNLSYTLSADLGEVCVNNQPQKNPAIVVKSGEGCYVEAKSSLGNVNLEYWG